MGTRRDTPPDRRAVDKNGRDHMQDSRLRELEEQLAKHEKDEFVHHERVEKELKQNSDAHEVIIEMFHKAEIAFTRAMGSIEQRVGALAEGRQGDRRAVVVGWVVLIGLSGFSAVLGGRLLDAHLTKLQEVAESVERTATIAAEASKKIDTWIPEATRWGNQLQADIDEAEGHSVERHQQQDQKLQRIDGRVRDLERRNPR